MWGVLAGSLIGLGFIGAFLGVILGGTGLLLLYFFMPSGAMVMAAETIWIDTTKYTLSSILIFILVGDLFFASGLASRSYRALNPIFQKVPGRLLHTNIVVCMLFGAVSGTSTATAAAVGSAAYPELKSRGYDRSFVLGSLAGGGTLGLLIPPSIALILFGAIMDVSIARLFLGGIVPGILLGLSFMLYIVIVALRRPTIVPADVEVFTRRESLISLLDLWPLILLMCSILGPLYMGLATPTESASFGVVLMLLLGFAVGHLSWANLFRTFAGTMIKFGAIGFVIIGALVLKQSVGILGFPKMAIEFMTEAMPGKYAALLVVVIFFLVLGCLFDGISLLLLASPFIGPLLFNYGFDPVWCGVLITILIEIGMITPPVGPNLFVLSSISGGVSIGQIAKATIPYWVIMILGIGVLTMFPGIVLWLPTLVMG